MRKALLIVGVLGALLLGVASVQAQDPPVIPPQPVQPQVCSYTDPYDHNGDGQVNWQDYDMWVNAVHNGMPTCKLDGLASGCPDWVDVNRDGMVTHADLMAMDAFRAWCMRMNTLPKRSW
jgi:hypothetical protein